MASDGRVATVMVVGVEPDVELAPTPARSLSTHPRHVFHAAYLTIADAAYIAAGWVD